MLSPAEFVPRLQCFSRIRLSQQGSGGPSACAGTDRYIGTVTGGSRSEEKPRRAGSVGRITFGSQVVPLGQSRQRVRV